jgi:CRISPR-associated protein Csb2
MFALRVRYLTGRVYSAIFEDGDTKRTTEWPPHPSRLFSALVSAWGEGGAEEELRPALQWLEEQPAPKIYAGHHSPRKLVQSYVPVNDDRKMPEERSRKRRAFPSAFLSDPDVYFVWESKPPVHLAAALDQILLRTSYLGQSSSLVAVEISDLPPERNWAMWQPEASKGVRMRVPHSGRLQDLCARYERFRKNPTKVHRPSVGRTTLYSKASGEGNQQPAQGVFDQMVVFRREAGPKASLRSTLSLLAALRGAIQKHSPDPIPEYLSGHSSGSTLENPVPSEKPHVALVPLSFIGAQHATGEILGAALLLPVTLTLKERTHCWDVASSITELAMPWGRWIVSLADAEERRRSLQSETWSPSHNIWSTVTPFVFDRYPKDPYGKEAEQVVRAAFARVGLPEPCELDLHYNPWHLGVPKASLFPPAPARPTKPQRYHCHVLAQFDQPIKGPVVAGAGRYYGYGFFAPLFSKRVWQ